ncbi:MAG: aminodeoxychorismate lyase [Candidatus Thiodiazotropha sp. (ex Lucinoma borealis)]|nr:aminodeoxychorismate lyase [Candidatus Thiodiazotropha sp. (ex Lucinoma borealis)]
MLINGIAGDQVPLSDRGLQYGDGLFETLAVINGQPGLWQHHIARLSRGEQVLGFPPSDKQLLKREALSLCAGHERAVLKIILTRGSGGRGYRPPASSHPRRILTLHPWPDYPNEWYAKGIRLSICHTRVSLNSQLAGLKHLNRLDQVLARSEWQDPTIAESLMLDDRDRVISGTQSNLFMIQGETILTPDLSQAGIAGVVRELVIEQAKQLSLPLRITDFVLDDVQQADALFVTNSLMGICPVAILDQYRFNIEKIPQKLHQAVDEILRSAL